MELDNNARASEAPDAVDAAAGSGNASAKADPDSGNKRKRSIKIAAIAALLIALLLGLAMCAQCSDNWFDPNAHEGSYAGKSEEDIIADLNRKVGEGMMNISIANTVKFDKGDGVTGTARIENIQANHYDQKVTITLDETGEVLYESGAIAPGHAIDEITISRKLDPGVHNATATFTGFDTETHKETGGKLAAQIKLAVY